MITWYGNSKWGKTWQSIPAYCPMRLANLLGLWREALETVSPSCCLSKFACTKRFLHIVRWVVWWKEVVNYKQVLRPPVLRRHCKVEYSYTLAQKESVKTFVCCEFDYTSSKREMSIGCASWDLRSIKWKLKYLCENTYPLYIYTCSTAWYVSWLNWF